MVVDHLCVVFAGPAELRWTIGRVAMPLFFLVAGHLSHRLPNWERFLLLIAVGLWLPVVVPWVDRPNVLLWYAVGVAVLEAARICRQPPVLLVVPALVLAANGVLPSKLGTGYDGASLVGLMAVGSSLPRTWWSWADRLPLGWLGRYPLTVYVGHIAVLQAVVAVRA